ncbi:bile acid:sodium symporter family protein [Planctomicrobium sp. SH668]|uniref:bile acid:sodium symporter family protein n=1 Tax=Planctomicrobium sp. SH668 TaxID=3448126 RepID=UPI003F5BC9C9
MFQFLARRWFLLALMGIIPFGVSLGLSSGSREEELISRNATQLFSGTVTAIVLFLMSVTLESGKILRAIRSPAAVIWGTAICLLIIPAAALAVVGCQSNIDLQSGLIAVAAVPSTLATASVWTRKAGGNDAVALLVTMLTNVVSFVVTPLWLSWGLDESTHFEAFALNKQLFLTALLPILAGQLMRMVRPVREFADRTQSTLNTVAQLCILVTILTVAFQSGARFRIDSQNQADSIQLPILVSLGICVGLHLAGLIAALLGGELLRFPKEDSIGAAFSGSQKSLPIGLYVVSSFEDVGPIACVPVMLYYVSQLVFDAVLIDWFHGWMRKNDDLHSDENPSEIS